MFIRILSIIVALVIVSASAYAQEKPFSVSGGIGWKSGYVLSNGVVASDKPVIQGNITVSWKNGFYGDLWYSGRLAGGPNTDFGNEIDLTAGYAGKIGELFKLDAGVAYYNISKVGTWGDVDIIDFYGEVSPQKSFSLGRAGEITPFVKVEILKAMNGTINNKVIPRAGVYHSITDGKWTVNQKLDISHNPNILGSDSGNAIGYEVGLNYALTKKITIGPMMKITDPVSIKGRPVQRVYGFIARMNF